MEKILVAGLDTVVGGNCAAWWADRYEVVGICWNHAVTISGCRGLSTSGDAAADAARLIATEKPRRILFAGPSSQSCWTAAEGLNADAARIAAAWAKAAADTQTDFTLVSSDAVFTGPWMFHRETGTCYCDTPAARMLRTIERDVADQCPRALIVRTNAFGWSPTEAKPGLVEQIYEALSTGQTLSLDYLRHATPILATDLADLLDAASSKGLNGIYHISGAERANPFRFACLMADEFNLPTSSVEPRETSLDQRKTFGGSETSLQTRRFKKALEVGVPLLREGLARLFEQNESGYRDRFSSPEGVLLRAA